MWITKGKKKKPYSWEDDEKVDKNRNAKPVDSLMAVYFRNNHGKVFIDTYDNVRKNNRVWVAWQHKPSIF